MVDVSPWRRRHRRLLLYHCYPLPPSSRSTVIFFPPGFVSRVYAIFSLPPCHPAAHRPLPPRPRPPAALLLFLSVSRVRCYVARYVFNTQTNSSGNRKFEIEALSATLRSVPSPPSPAATSLPPPRPSFSRITLDHRWSSRAWHRTRGCVIELGKWNDSARTRAFFVSRPRHFRPFPGQRYSCAFSPFLSN